jgi:hypothetical protein
MLVTFDAHVPIVKELTKNLATIINNLEGGSKE